MLCSPLQQYAVTGPYSAMPLRALCIANSRSFPQNFYAMPLILNPNEPPVVALDNDVLENCIVYDYENRAENKIYDMEKTTGNDMYEIFLGGSKSLISIENPNAKTDRELVMFRDSFGSSIAPLLAEDYAKITLVDIRYLPVERIGNYIDFKDQDVLFLYSTSVLNHSETLK